MLQLFSFPPGGHLGYLPHILCGCPINSQLIWLLLWGRTPDVEKELCPPWTGCFT